MPKFDRMDEDEIYEAINEMCHDLMDLHNLLAERYGYSPEQVWPLIGAQNVLAQHLEEMRRADEIARDEAASRYQPDYCDYGTGVADSGIHYCGDGSVLID